MGRNTLGSERLYAGRRGLYTAGHQRRETCAVVVGQPVAVAQGAQPACLVRRRRPAVPGATRIVGEGNELPGDLGEIPRGRRR
ncbi:MAG: hypothetical protein ACRDTR_13860 [Rubrobacter sp.]